VQGGPEGLDERVDDGLRRIRPDSEASVTAEEPEGESRGRSPTGPGEAVSEEAVGGDAPSTEVLRGPLKGPTDPAPRRLHVLRAIHVGTHPPNRLKTSEAGLI
jgi:hypothetical protein